MKIVILVSDGVINDVLTDTGADVLILNSETADPQDTIETLGAKWDAQEINPSVYPAIVNRIRQDFQTKRDEQLANHLAETYEKKGICIRCGFGYAQHEPDGNCPMMVKQDRLGRTP